MPSFHFFVDFFFFIIDHPHHPWSRHCHPPGRPHRRPPIIHLPRTLSVHPRHLRHLPPTHVQLCTNLEVIQHSGSRNRCEHASPFPSVPGHVSNPISGTPLCQPLFIVSNHLGSVGAAVYGTVVCRNVGDAVGMGQTARYAVGDVFGAADESPDGCGAAFLAGAR